MKKLRTLVHEFKKLWYSKSGGKDRMVTAIHVANSILNHGFDENIEISPMKLQKLIYLIYKEYLQITNNPLFSERIEAWKYGPVVRSVYDEFKEYGPNAIRRYAKNENGKIYLVDKKSSSKYKQAFDCVWKKYKNIGGIPLAAMTHQNDTAWEKAVDAKRRYLYDEDIKVERELKP